MTNAVKQIAGKVATQAMELSKERREKLGQIMELTVLVASTYEQLSNEEKPREEVIP